MGNLIAHRQFASLAPAGYYVALRVGFAFPVAEENRFPAPWIAAYTAQGLMPHDPVMHWVHGHSGAIRWSEIDLPDPMNVLCQAADAGLRYGVAASCPDAAAGQRSFGLFARSDREFTATEMRVLEARLRCLHQQSLPPRNLTRAEIEALRHVKSGKPLRAIAEELGVTEGAIKQRLKNGKEKLEARNSTQAVVRATQFGLI
ncbi:autoinducer binding domain-containing protein [Actibacterium sp. MT2.3-13A]|uniref:helix-turn-helix transcriptional regulator n=1 Tax=Actibacterium sp. MT2.3-13A TaxID=2828332 RepID=UPI001BA74DDD|nr:autoinducer binding domain-containing protein [Actibacterium sp. MT2.3-13A]